MKKIILVTLLLMGLTVTVSQAQSNLQMESYFPAPFGAFDRVRLVPQAVNTMPYGGDCTGLLGTLGVELPSNLRLCTDIGGGVAQWEPLPDIWTQNGNFVFPSDTATNANLKIGIGTTSPQERLHVDGGTDETIIQIEGIAGQQIGIDLEQGGALRGTLEFDNQGNLVVQSKNTAQLHLGAGGTDNILTADVSGFFGIHDPSPDALLEVAAPGGNPDFFRVSSSNATEGDIFDIEGDRQVFVNTAAAHANRGLSARMVISGIDGSGGNSYIGILKGDDDIIFNGGDDDHNARFVHNGNTPSWINFASDPFAAGAPVNLMQVNNSGDMYVNNKLYIGKDNPGAVNPLIQAWVDLFVYEPNAGKDVVMLISDEETTTGIKVDFLTTDVIGAFMPAKNLDNVNPNNATSTGGLMVLGLQDGGANYPAGINIGGIIPSAAAAGQRPAVEVEGTRYQGGQLHWMDDEDVVLSVNYMNGYNDGDDGFVVTAAGDVGMGMAYGESPQARLHVKGTLLLQPRKANGIACDNDGDMGVLYANEDFNTLCLCTHDNGSPPTYGWQPIAPTVSAGGSCP